jgi:photosynthetic reaction center cytochrome c subunit
MRIRSSRLVAVAAVVLSVSIAATAVHARQIKVADGQRTAGEVFENVQVLKDVTVDDFMTLMGLMTASVGGDCASCHKDAGTNVVDWAFDIPRKEKAREMASMVQAINADHFGGRQVVSCWSCHRGRTRPILTPTLDQVYGEPDLLPEDLVYGSSAGLARPDEIIDRYLQAIGGAPKLAAVTTITATGSSVGFRGFGGGGMVELYAKRPDQRSMIIRYKVAGRDATVRNYDGTLGWIRTPLNVLGEYQLHGSELTGARLDAMLTFPDEIKTALTRLRTLDPQEIDGKWLDVVQGDVVGAGGMFATLYFDPETGLLLRTVRYGASPIGRMPTEMNFGDYRDVGGIKLAHRVEFVWLDGRDAIQLEEMQLGAPIDSNKFGRPTAVEPLP